MAGELKPERPVLHWVVGLSLAALAVWGLYRVGGVFGLVLGAPLVGLAAGLWVTRVGFGLVRDRSRQIRFGELQGRHHAFRGTTVRIEQDGEHFHVALDDAVKALAIPAGERREVVRKVRLGYAGAVAADEDGTLWMREDAVRRWLDARAVHGDRSVNQFRLWLERDTLPPMRRAAGLDPGGPRAPVTAKDQASR